MAQFRAQIRIEEGLRGLEVYGCNGPLGEDPVRDHKRFILIKEKQLATKYY